MKWKTMYIVLSFIIGILVLFPSGASAEPLSDMIPTSDLPETEAPVVQYNQYPLAHYSMDTYTPKEDESFWEKYNPFNAAGDAFSKNMAFAQQKVLDGSWYGYKMFVIVGIYVVHQAFTFDLIGSMLEHIAGFIAEIGGEYGIGQFITFMLILTSAWLIYSFAKKEYRNTVGGLLTAAILSAFFTVYVQNADQVLGELNDLRRDVSTELLGASTYAMNDTPTNMKQDDNNVQESRKGLSRMHNILHDLLIVKPHLMLEFGTTNLAEIGGADSPDEYSAANVAKGKKIYKNLLESDPGSEERKRIIKKHEADSLFSANNTVKRIIILAGAWIVAVCLLVFLGYIAVMTHIFGMAFLLTAIIGVFILLMGIFPAWRGFVYQWTEKLLGFLAMSVMYTFMLIVVFGLINVSYQVGAEKNWGYVPTVALILIILAAAAFMQRQLFGYKLYRNYKQQIRNKVEEHKKKRQDSYSQPQPQLQPQPAFNGNNNAGYAGHTPGGQSGQEKSASRPDSSENIKKRMRRMRENSNHSPLKTKQQQTKQDKADSGEMNSNETPGQSGNSKKQLKQMQHMKQQGRHDGISKQNQADSSNDQQTDQQNKQQPSSGSDQRFMSEKQRMMEHMRRRKNEDKSPIKKQPKTPAELQSAEPDKQQTENKSMNRTAEQLKKAKQKREQEQNNVVTFQQHRGSKEAAASKENTETNQDSKRPAKQEEQLKKQNQKAKKERDQS